MFVSPLPFMYRYAREAAKKYVHEYPILDGITWRTVGDVDDCLTDLVCRVEVIAAQPHGHGPRQSAMHIRAMLYMSGPDGDVVAEASDALIQAIEKAWGDGMTTPEGWATYIEWTQLSLPTFGSDSTADYINMATSLQVTARKGA